MDRAPLGKDTAYAPVACRTDIASSSPSVITTLVADGGTVCMPKKPRSPPAGWDSWHAFSVTDRNLMRRARSWGSPGAMAVASEGPDALAA
jgi:hypothetical protein